jgi:sortase A
VRWFGYLCLMAAAGFGGYVGWLLWGTGLETQRAQDALRAGFEETIDTRPPPATDAEATLPGQAYAQIEIPSIGVNFIVVEGTGYETLKKGPGHYPDTADPWDEAGRVGIAGHRTTYLHPFLELEQASVGSRIVLRTRFGTYTYEIARNFVIPSAGSGRVLAQDGPPSLVLTTCHPRYSSAERLIVTATLVAST